MSEAASENSVYSYADGLGQNSGGEEEAEATQPWVSFRLNGQAYALPVEVVREVLRVGGITRVPQASHGVRGVTNMRGRVLPVLDLRVRLGFEASATDDRSRILVVPGESGPVGLLVDQVEQMIPLAPSSLQEPPDRLEAVAHFALGVVLGALPGKKDLLVLLDLDPVLDLTAA